MLRAIKAPAFSHLENLFARDIAASDFNDAVLRVDLRYSVETSEHNPSMRNIALENVSSKNSQGPLVLLRIQAAATHLVIANCRFENAAKPSLIEPVDLLELRNLMQPRGQ